MPWGRTPVGSAAATTLFLTAAERLEGEPIDPTEVSEQARLILSDPRYAQDSPSLLERILGPVYDWLERIIAFVMETFTRLLEWLSRALNTDAITLLGPILIVVVAAAGAWVLARRRARDIERRATIERILKLGTDPADLEARAVGADEAGDHTEAIRLRFVAGLLRLDAEGSIEFYPGLSNGTISDQLDNPTFDRLAAQFDQVVYGRKPASRDDSVQAAADWTTMLGAHV